MPATPELQALLDRRFHLTHGGPNQRGRLGCSTSMAVLTARNSTQRPNALWPVFKRPMSVPAAFGHFDQQRANVWKSRARMYYPQKTSRAKQGGDSAVRPCQQVLVAHREACKKNQAMQTEEEQETAQASCSESRLRRVMTSTCALTEELRQAIGSVEALLAEAKRELAARELRERRAAYERLYNAMGSSNASELEEAIAVASGLDIDATDIDLSKSRLEHLRSLSAAEVAEQEARKQLMETKLRAFRLVKQGKSAALQELLQDASFAGKWSQWRDHSGRSLLAYAKQVRSTTVQDCLERLLALEVADPQAQISPGSPSSSSISSPRSPPGISQPSPHRSGQEFIPNHVPRDDALSPKILTAANEARRTLQVATPETLIGPTSPPRVTTPNVAPWPAETRGSAISRFADSSGSPCSHAAADTSLASPGNAEGEIALRLQAFRAVVKDDAKELNNILNGLSLDVWSSWQNKAGKDLLTLAQERGATGSYAVIGKVLGILQERKCEAFEERETVWVLVPGEVQARHGTVVEDAPADGDGEVLIEFWDRPGPPQKVDRAQVLRAM